MSEINAAIATVTPAAKRRPSAILADIEAKVDQLHLARTAHETAIADLHALRTEYTEAAADIAAVFNEVDSFASRATAWFEKQL